MFKSKVRSINFSQYEHGRLAGTLARLWGNDAFDRPPLDFDAFVAGVTLHDWGYGVVDNLPIGEAPEEEWLQVMRNGIAKRHDHPTTDMVTKHHMRRLLSFYSSPERQALIDEIDGRIEERLQEGDITLETFQKADKITQLCDMISFSFCFELPGEWTYPVFSHPDAQEMTEITFDVRPGGVVHVDPWPFAIPLITGVQYAFQRQGYPETLDPLIVPYTITRRP